MRLRIWRGRTPVAPAAPTASVITVADWMMTIALARDLVGSGTVREAAGLDAEMDELSRAYADPRSAHVRMLAAEIHQACIDRHWCGPDESPAEFRDRIERTPSGLGWPLGNWKDAVN